MVVEVDAAEHLDAHDRDGREHGQRGAAEDGQRDAGCDSACFRDHADEHHETAGRSNDPSALIAVSRTNPTFSAKQV